MVQRWTSLSGEEREGEADRLSQTDCHRQTDWQTDWQTDRSVGDKWGEFHPLDVQTCLMLNQCLLIDEWGGLTRCLKTLVALPEAAWPRPPSPIASPCWTGWMTCIWTMRTLEPFFLKFSRQISTAVAWSACFTSSFPSRTTTSRSQAPSLEGGQGESVPAALDGAEPLGGKIWQKILMLWARPFTGILP